MVGAARAAVGAVGICRQRGNAGRVLEMAGQRQRIFLVGAATPVAADGHREFAAGQDRNALARGARLQRESGMIGADAAGLALEIAAEVDALLAGTPSFSAPPPHRSLLPPNHFPFPP